jgi:hypothetical protein
VPLAGPDWLSWHDSGRAVGPNAAHTANDAASKTRRAIMEELLWFCAVGTTPTTEDLGATPWSRAAKDREVCERAIPSRELGRRTWQERRT